MNSHAAAEGDLRGLPAPLDNPEFLGGAGAVIARYPRHINALLSVLQLAAGVVRLTPREDCAVARFCWAAPEQGLLAARAYGLPVANEQLAQVTVCMNIHCQLAGSESLRDACRTMLQDKPVIVDEVFCFGHCTEGPCVEVNGRLITEATPDLVLAGLHAIPATDPIAADRQEAAEP